LQTGEGSFYTPYSRKAKNLLERASADLGISVRSVSKRPARLTGKLSSLHIALWDMYGGSMSSGWLKWILEQHRFPFSSIYAKEIDAGDLRKKYDVIIFVSGAIPALSSSDQPVPVDTAKQKDIPAEYLHQLGKISAERSVPALEKFLEAGGTIVTIGKSTSLAYHLKLGVTNALVEMNKGKQVSLPADKFYIPGSLLRVKIDSTLPAAWGMGSGADIFFDSSPVFTLNPEAVSKGKIKPILWFDTARPLRSGWAFGQEYLQNGVAAFEARLGAGKLYAFGPEITFRAQTYSTFKLLFNQLYSGY
jgi:hypothetical protein